MKTPLHRSLPLGAAIAVTSAGLAFAATPVGGDVYSGTIDLAGPDKNPPTIKLKVAANGQSLKATFACGGGEKYSLKHVPIDGGSFRKTGKIAKVDVTIKGSFKTKSKAKGSIDTVICFIQNGTFTARS